MFRAQIEKSLLTIAQKNHLTPPSSFRELVELYEFSKYASDNPEESLLSHIENGDWRGVQVAVKQGAQNWPYALKLAAEKGNLRLVKFFLEKWKEDVDWYERNAKPVPGFLDPNYGTVLSSNAILLYIWATAEEKALDAAKEAGNTDVVAYLEKDMSFWHRLTGW